MRRTAIRAANVFFTTAGLVWTITLLFTLYRYGWVRDRQFANLVGAFLYLGLPSGLAILSFGLLRLKARNKLKLALLYFTMIGSVYFVELALSVGQFVWGSPEITTDSMPARARRAKQLGLQFDERTRLQVNADLRSRGIDVVQVIGNQNSNELRILGGIANKTTVFCNENGTYTVYDSDEHGFHNPSGSWTRTPVDIAALGDSFTQGACVPSDKNVVALIRKFHPATVNLGIMGMGPLSELAVLKEYLPALRPKVTLWLYFEGNDIADLESEKTNATLMRYIDGSFSQGLLNRQEEIDNLLRELVNQGEADEKARLREEIAKTPTRWRSIRNLLVEHGKVTMLRQKLGLVYGKARNVGKSTLDLDPQLLPLFRQILSEAKNTVHSWGGSFYFVYLPQWERYSHPDLADTNRDVILAMVRGLDIDTIDLQPVFQAHPDPLTLFPFRGFGHYNEAGHEVAAKTLVQVIGETPSIGKQR